MVSPVEMSSQDFATRAIRQAARETGADFNFLIETAARESNFQLDAQARTSSAAGMFQFIEQTWLGVMQRRGAEHGYADAAAAISQDGQGRYVVSDPEQRQRILDLRFDAVAASRMAGELAAENAGIIEARIGRPVDSGELYVAHFLGAGGAASLIEAAEQQPQTRADQLFPAAARANRTIFYDGGRARNAAEVLAELTGRHGDGAGASSRPARGLDAAAPMTAPVFASASAPASGPAMAPVIGRAQDSDPVAGAVRRIAEQGWRVAPAPIRNAMAPDRTAIGNGELSPALVEILASLEAPRAARARSS
ncbi:hypothetical protein [Maricaulis sp. CAU 1757]